MLVSFSLKNVMSYKNEALLDLEATSLRTHNYSLIEAGTKKLLPVISIYGANASGKTNLIRAMQQFLKLIAGTIPDEDDHFIVFPYAYQNEPDESSVFTLTCIVSGIEVEYRVEINTLYVLRETLRVKEPHQKRFLRLFDRKPAKALDSEEWVVTCTKNRYASTTVINEIKYVNQMEQNKLPLLLTVLGKRGKIPFLRHMYRWALRHASFDSDFVPSKGFPLFISGDLPITFSKDEEKKKDYLAFLNSINNQIIDFSVEDMGDDLARKMILLKYDSFLPDELMTLYESRGVHKSLLMYPRLHEVLSSGGLLIIDEMESSFHPLLMAEVINLFTSPETNPGKGQLIFTTHNALIMDKRFFRQDEIWFVEKDESGCSDLYSLADFADVRSDLDFCKNYILGKFGAIPEFAET